ncbi:MAG: endo alpha-1,4 polygalactosaminidase [Pseudonocardia sp.]
MRGGPAAVACALTMLVSCASITVTGEDDADRWVPRVGETWQIQLQGAVDTSIDADVYDVDLFDVDEAVVDALGAEGAHVMCYLSAGTFEEWRDDASRFPDEVVGKPLKNWPGEHWLDVRRLDVLEPILADRLDLCRAKGFDAVDPDNLDGYTQDSGFPLTAEDQLRFNRLVARLAHERSLAVGLKNDLEQVGELVSEFDFAINESCVATGECHLLTPFIAAGKPVFHIEYVLRPVEFCAVTVPLRFSSVWKPRDLTVPWEWCPAPDG